jgi:hypothetical protein
MTYVRWQILTYRFGPDAGTARVAVWRELRKLGALALQQATWAFPDEPELAAGLDRTVSLVEASGGQALVVQVADNDQAAMAELEARFTDEREAEWAEFLGECAKYSAEIAKEIAKEKFTLAELDEEEESLERLRRWFRRLRGRDLFGAPSASIAEGRLKECAEALEGLAARIYDARGQL